MMQQLWCAQQYHQFYWLILSFACWSHD